jgi:hypothetical protein
MTRETKIGLVVAGSFLCLVAIVVASKWNRGDVPSNDPEEQSNKVAAVTPKPNDKPAEVEKKDVPPTIKITPQPVQPVNPELEQFNRVAVDPNLPKQTPAPEFKPRPVTPLPDFKPLFPESQPKDPSDKKDTVVPVAGTDKPVQVPAPFPIKPAEDKKPELTVPMTEKPVTMGDLPTFPKVEEKKEDKTLPVIPINNTPEKKDPGIPPLTSKEQPPAVVVPKDGLPPFDPIKKPEVVIPPPTVIIPMDEKKTGNPSDGLVFPPLPKKEPVEQKVPVIPSNPKDTPALPTINVGGGVPIVNRHEPDFVECMPGELSFTQLSKRFYGDEKYGDALLAYNRDNRVILKHAANIMESPPKLAPGVQVLKPAVAQLEKEYRALIRAGTVPAAIVPETPPPTVKLTPPVKLGNSTPITATIPQAAPGRYVVQTQGGERIRDIAQRFLGNPDRWPEIYRLNPSVQPQFPVPMGTDLKMPGN